MDAAFTGYSGTYASEMNIPKKVDGVVMTAVGSGASGLFSNNSIIVKISIPDGVTRISNFAFWYCQGLTEINIPEGVTSVGIYAFAYCCKLSALELPDSLTQIGQRALQSCYALEELSIPAGVTDIGDGVINNCTSLITLTVSPENTVYDSRDNCNAIIKTETNALKAGCQQTVIPDTVKQINDNAFYGCTGLIEVTLPDEVTSIGDYAFYGCTGLTEVTLPDEVTSIGGSAFYRCTGLTEIIFSEGLTSIGNYAFHGCTGLTEVVLPEGLTNIGDYAFYQCSSLTEVRLSEGLTVLGNGVFSACERLEEIALPSSLTTIGSECFRNCAVLQEITIPDRVTEIGSYAFSGCSALKSVTLPRCLKSVYYQLFYGCTALEEITIPKQVSSINSQAFYGCTSLREVNIHQGVISIKSDSFSGCTNALTFYTPEGAYAASYAEENDITVVYVEKDAWDDFANSWTDYVSADASDTTGRIDEFKAGLYLEYNDIYSTSILNEQTISEDGDYIISYKATEAITSMEALRLVTNLRELSEHKQTSGFLTVTGVSVQYNGQTSCFKALDTEQNYWVPENWSGYSVYGYNIIDEDSETQAASGAGLTLLPGDILQVHFTVSGMGIDDSEPTSEPTATPIPVEDQDQAFLMFTDGSWSWGNWNTKVAGGFGKDATITGNGDYSVSIDADDWVEYNEDNEDFELSTADGAIVLCVDIRNLCNSPNLDVSEMEVSNVKIYADNKSVSVNNSKILMGNIEGKGDYRMEIMNQYGSSVDDPAIDPDALTFRSSLKVTFTLSGIKKGSSNGAFSCDSDGDGKNDTFYAVSDAAGSWSAAGTADPNPIYTAVLPSATPKATATLHPGSASSQPSAAVSLQSSGTPKASLRPAVISTPARASTPTVRPRTTSTPGKTSTPDTTTAVNKNSLKVSGVKVKLTPKLKSGYLYVPQVKLTWKKNASADGYEVWRKAPGANKYTEVENLNPSGVLSWTDTSVRRGRTYSYKIRPYQVSDEEDDEIIEGVYSSEAKLTVKASLKKPVITVIPAKKRVTLTFIRAEGSHYQTRYRYLGDKKWKKISVMTGKKIKKKIVKRLNATGFQMQVRTYCTVNGKTVYSKWSAAKTIR